MPERYTPWIKRIAQLGLISKGIVYILFGVLILIATYTAEEPIGLLEVVEFIINLDIFGRSLVTIMSFGLLSYAAWKWLQMVHNIEGYDKDLHGYFVRLTWLGPFLFYVLLAGHAFNELYRWYFGKWDWLHREQGWVTQFFASVPGKYVVGFLALMFLVNAGTLFYLAFTGKYTLMLTGRGFYQNSPRLARITGLIGYLGYGLALLITGGLFAYSIYFTGQDYTEGQVSMFYYLIEKPLGQFMLTVISSGTVCYGIYFLLTAVYRWKSDGQGSSNTLDVLRYMNQQRNP